MHTKLRPLARRGALVILWTALALSSSAQAGLLGGGAGGSIGGFGGSVGGSVTRDGALPRPDRAAADAARQTGTQADAAAERVGDRMRSGSSATKERADRAVGRARDAGAQATPGAAQGSAAVQGEANRGNSAVSVGGSAEAALQR